MCGGAGNCGGCSSCDISIPKGQDGQNGLSAYQIAVANGFSGTESEWLASLVGAAGTDGNDGEDGTDGTNGLGYKLFSATNISLPAGATESLIVDLDAADSAYTSGARVRVASAGSPTNYFEGIVTSYTGTTMVIAVENQLGTGTFTDWDINIAGIPGSIVTSNWVDYEYNSAYLDATSGTWTIASASDFLVKYKIEGKTCYFNYRIANGTIDNTPASLKLTLPAGIVPAGSQWNSIGYYNDSNNTPTTGVTRNEINAGDARLFISNLSDSPFATITGGLDVLGQIFFEIQ